MSACTYNKGTHFLRLERHTFTFIDNFAIFSKSKNILVRHLNAKRITQLTGAHSLDYTPWVSALTVRAALL